MIKTTPAVGWVRADELPNKDATLEILKLSRRVEELESELARVRTVAPKGSEDLAQGEELYTLWYSFTAQEDVLTSTSWTGKFQVTWNSIFALVAPSMISEASELTLRKALNEFVVEQNLEEFQKNNKLKNCSLSSFSIKEEDFQTIKVQLRALGLIAKSERTRSVKDVATYWTLTPYGDNTMTRLRAIKRSIVPKEAPVVAKEEKEEPKG